MNEIASFFRFVSSVDVRGSERLPAQEILQGMSALGCAALGQVLLSRWAAGADRGVVEQAALLRLSAAKLVETPLREELGSLIRGALLKPKTVGVLLKADLFENPEVYAGLERAVQAEYASLPREQQQALVNAFDKMRGGSASKPTVVLDRGRTLDGRYSLG